MRRGGWEDYGDRRYRITQTGKSSEQFGPCEICGEWVSGVAIQLEERRECDEAGEYWTPYNCPILFGLESCLREQRDASSEPAMTAQE